MRKRTGILIAWLTAMASAWAQIPSLDPFPVSVSLKRSAEKELTLSVTIVAPPGHYLYREDTGIEMADGVRLVPRKVPIAKDKYDELSEAVVGVYEGKSTWEYAVDVATALPLRVRAKYRGCTETPQPICFPDQAHEYLVHVGSSSLVVPIEKNKGASLSKAGSWQEQLEHFEMTGREAGYLPPREFLEFLDRVKSGNGFEQKTLAGKGVLLLVLITIVSGLLLNLTPCVLPMIPINIAIIGAGSHGGSRVRGAVLGTIYGAGIAFAYGLLGLLVVLTGARFGMLNASPAFNIGIALVFLALSLAMFGVFNIDLTRFQGGRGPQAGGFGAAFVLGAIAALLAGACVAPAVIAVLVESTMLYARGVNAGLLLPFLLGLGMALPWPFAGAGLSFLPKAGKWMDRVKYLFGVMILAAAAYYGHLGYSLMTYRWDSGAVEEGWYHSIDEALSVARRDNKPVFVDIWASGCKACKKMDTTTFKEPDVAKRLDDNFVKLKYRAEPQSNPDVKAALAHFVKTGLPTYVVLTPKKEGARW